VRGKASEAKIRREILAHLPFQPALAVRPAQEVVALVKSKPFEGVRFSRDLRGWAAAITGSPKAEPALPLSKPMGKAWSVRFDRVESGFALGLWQRRPGGFVFPSDVVEASLGVPATMRWWETLEKVAAIIEK
jgi:hypothetical protein